MTAKREFPIAILESMAPYNWKTKVRLRGTADV
jgi:hypothetical protein